MFNQFRQIHHINGHFRNLNWRYLPYIRPIFEAYVRGYTPKIWPYMVQYLHFRILNFPLTIFHHISFICSSFVITESSKITIFGKSIVVPTCFFLRFLTTTGWWWQVSCSTSCPTVWVTSWALTCTTWVAMGQGASARCVWCFVVIWLFLLIF